MPDVFIYNGSKQNIDTASSMEDIVFRRSVLVPPGQQARIVLPDQPAADTFVAAKIAGGAVDHATIKNTVTFTGVSISTVVGPVSARGIVPTIAGVHTIPKAVPKR